MVGVARDGQEGLDFASKLQPDVITMDIEMPVMDGLTALRFVMREAPTQVLMLSSLTTEGSVASLQALKLGAADVLAKDASQFSANITKIKDELLTRVRALGRSRARRAATAKTAPPASNTAGSAPPSAAASSIWYASVPPPVARPCSKRSSPPCRRPSTPPSSSRSTCPNSSPDPWRNGSTSCAPSASTTRADGMPIEKRSIYIAPADRTRRSSR